MGNRVATFNLFFGISSFPGNPKFQEIGNYVNHEKRLTEFMTHSTKEKHKQKLISNFEFCFRGCFLTTLSFLPPYLK